MLRIVSNSLDLSKQRIGIFFKEINTVKIWPKTSYVCAGERLPVAQSNFLAFVDANPIVDENKSYTPSNVLSILSTKSFKDKNSGWFAGYFKSD